MVTMYYRTKGQEALETYQPESGASLKDESSQQMTSLGSWVDITSQKQLRGIFSQALFNILRKQEKLILQDLYKALNDGMHFRISHRSLQFNICILSSLWQ